MTVCVCMLVSAMFMESSNVEKIYANHESILLYLMWFMISVTSIYMCWIKS